MNANQRKLLAQYLNDDLTLHGAATQTGRPYQIDPGKLDAALDYVAGLDDTPGQPSGCADGAAADRLMVTRIFDSEGISMGGAVHRDGAAAYAQACKRLEYRYTSHGDEGYVFETAPALDFYPTEDDLSFLED